MSELREPDVVDDRPNWTQETWFEEVTVTIAVNRYVWKDGEEPQFDWEAGGSDSGEWYETYDDALRDAIYSLGG